MNLAHLVSNVDLSFDIFKSKIGSETTSLTLTLLAPDLPSNGSSLKDLKCTHSNHGASEESRIVIFRHYLPVPGVGNLRACCLPWMW